MSKPWILATTAGAVTVGEACIAFYNAQSSGHSIVMWMALGATAFCGIVTWQIVLRAR